ncbi:hypothetical protein [Streptomyces lycii]|uniref:hypothetical protein n=1 Tax=Streptomyces lycii TaxID=2654337 RepID=UPI0012E0F870|nr:hypothetical protein [Streptomyces lycii]
MPQHTPALADRCPDCAGFSRVAVTTGHRDPDGSRRTITATCPACHGSGKRVPAAVVRAGR